MIVRQQSEETLASLSEERELKSKVSGRRHVNRNVPLGHYEN